MSSFVNFLLVTVYKVGTCLMVASFTCIWNPVENKRLQFSVATLTVMHKKLTSVTIIRLNKTPTNKKPAKPSGSSSAKVNVNKSLCKLWGRFNFNSHEHATKKTILSPQKESNHNHTLVRCSNHCSATWKGWLIVRSAI